MASSLVGVRLPGHVQGTYSAIAPTIRYVEYSMFVVIDPDDPRHHRYMVVVGDIDEAEVEISTAKAVDIDKHEPKRKDISYYK